MKVDNLTKINSLLKSNNDKNIILGLELLYHTLEWSLEEIAKYCLMDGNMRFDVYSPCPCGRYTHFQYMTCVNDYRINLKNHKNSYHEAILNNLDLNFKTRYFHYRYYGLNDVEDFYGQMEKDMKRTQTKFIRILLKIQETDEDK